MLSFRDKKMQNFGYVSERYKLILMRLLAFEEEEKSYVGN